jgi:glycosyltransferase involved in cell wall biosynthesis
VQTTTLSSGYEVLMDIEKAKKIAIFASFSGAGGVERMLVNLAGGLAADGCSVDLVVARATSKHLQQLPAGVRLVRLGTSHTFTSLFRLAAYLRRERPDALLAAKERACRTAVLARRLSGVKVRLGFRLGTTVSAAFENKAPWRFALWCWPMRWFYRQADAVVAVSDGVRQDLLKITQLPPERFHVVRNPVITAEMERLSQVEVDDPWFSPGAPPVIMGLGRLTEQKDFFTLLQAFALVHRERPCRLLILGEGGDRPALEELAAQLGVTAALRLPGFEANPYCYLRRAQLFVLSSRWEGSPNALTEAMALGIPVVATDCPSGPNELLPGAGVGELVAMGDAEAMATAMERMLDSPPSAAAIRAAVADYNVTRSAQHYRCLLLGESA